MDSPSVPHGLGYAVGTLAALESLRSPGGLGRFLMSRAEAMQDPNIRAGLQGSPFTAGFLGVGGQAAPDVPPGIAADRMARAGVRPGQFTPDLPPLSPEQAVKSRIAGATGQLLQQPGMAEQAARSQLGIPQAAFDPAQAAALGLRLKSVDSQGRAQYIAEPPAEPKLMPVPGAPQTRYDPRQGKYFNLPQPPGAAAAATVATQEDMKAQQLGFTGRNDPRYVDAIRRQAEAAGLIPPAAAPAPGPAAGPVQGGGTSTAPTPFQALPDDAPIGQLGQPQRQSFLGRIGALLGPASAQAAEGPGPQQVAQAQPGPLFGGAAAAPSRLAGPAVPQGTLPPGTKVSSKLGPFNVTRSGPSASAAAKKDFAEASGEKALKVLVRAKQAIQTLRDKGIISDNPVLGSSGYNYLHLQYAARAGDKETQRDAQFLLKNLQSTVPALARGFGEARVNVQEEQRIREALSFTFQPASAAEAVIDNYIELFSTGQQPLGGHIDLR